MPLQAPTLDDRTFDDLVQEVILRVPVYAPEWTDFNESDPGRTLIELFAWLTELTIYRLNQVPDLNYVKFLQLVGLQLRPAQPATAHLTFTPQGNSPFNPQLPAWTTIPEGSQVGASPAGGGPILIFETTADLDPIPYNLGGLQVFDGASYTSVLANNQATGQPFAPFGPAPGPGCALYFGFDPPQGYSAGKLDNSTRLFPQELQFRVFLAPTTQTTRPSTVEVGGPPPPAPPVRIVWEYKQADGPYWTRLTTFKDDSLAFTREGAIQVEGPAQPAATLEGKASPADKGPTPRFWIRARIDSGSYPVGSVPEIDFIRPNVIDAVNLATVTNEVIGTSDGSASQTFTVSQTPISLLPNSDGSIPFTLAVEGDGASTTWSLVDDLLGYGRDDQVYTLDPATGVVTFGDGDAGQIPSPGFDIVVTSYRYGGGTSGNVASGQISSPLSNLGNVTITNERPAVGGRDEQSVDDLKGQAPAQIRGLSRAVTAGDFTALAQQAGGVARAQALPGLHPDVPGAAGLPGVVTVVIIPDVDVPAPIASDDQLRSTAAYLDQFRLVTCEVYVAAPKYTRITATASVTCDPTASPDRITQAIDDALNSFLDPIGRTWRGGAVYHPQPGDPPAPASNPRPFGQAFVPTRLFSVIQGVPGVRAIENLSVTKGEPYSTVDVGLTETVVLPPDGLLYGQDHDIQVTPDTSGK